MSEGGDQVDSTLLSIQTSMEMIKYDVRDNKNKGSSSDLKGKLLEDGKGEKQIGSCFRVGGSALKDIENQGLLEELEALEKVECRMDAMDVALSSRSSPPPVFQRRRGRPRKGTYIPCSLSTELVSSSNSSQISKFTAREKTKRKRDSLRFNESTDIEYHYHSGSEQTNFRGKSKRRRQPKVLDDYVTDFDTSDEELEKLSRSGMFQFSKKGSCGSGRNRKSNALHSLESDEILSYYLDEFNENLPDHDFADEFLDGSKEDENITAPASRRSLVSNVLHDSKVTRRVCTANYGRETSEWRELEDYDNASSSREKVREWKCIIKSQQQQLSAMQQRCTQLLQKLQKKPQMTRMVDLVHGASKLLTEEQLVFFTLQLKSNYKNLQGVRFSAREKILALAIYAHSPDAYKWLQSIFYLPTKLILDRWLEVIAKSNPDTAKRLIYCIFKKYIFSS